MTPDSDYLADPDGVFFKELRNEVIEECAQIAEDRQWGVHTPLETIAAAIRALKDKP